MIAKPLTAILMVTLLFCASGTVGSFYFASSQGQTISEPAELALSESESSPGSIIEVEGVNFAANSQVSIYFMSAEEIDLTDGTAFILQGIDDATQRTATISSAESVETSTPSDANSEEALHTLRNLLDTTSISESNLLVALEESAPMNGTMGLECEDRNIAQGQINGTIGVFGISPGTYNECSISISDGDITDTGEIDELAVVSNSEENYENSLLASETANEEGTFESSVTVPNVEEGEYAILAIADNLRTAVSTVSVTVAEPVTEPATNTSATNATEGVIMNETVTPPALDEEEDEEGAAAVTTTPIQNQTQNNQTDTAGEEPTVQLDETSEEPATNTSATNATEDVIMNETVTTPPALDEEEDEGGAEEEEQLIEEEPAELLTAEIISNGTQGVAPATFEFQANVTGGTESYTYSWDFDDDSEGSDEQTLEHTFEEAGTY
ncbi:MAG: PKD domain-containing protein, partial [Thermoproteota archaeon]|nr:PKD domain-containing protein [Thermoproteota archaeon]